MLFVSIIGFGFLYDIAIARLNVPQLAHSFIAPSFGSSSIRLIVGIIGATVMPHALYVHSALTKNRLTDGSSEEKKRLLTLHIRESVPVFLIAGAVNAAILIVSAVALYPKYSNVATVDDAYRIMIPVYGSIAAVVFAITLLCSGLASSATRTLAGQTILAGMLGRKANHDRRRFIIRIVHVFPTPFAVLLRLFPLFLLV